MDNFHFYIQEMTKAHQEVVEAGFNAQECIAKIIDLERQFVKALGVSRRFQDTLNAWLDYIITQKDLRSVKSYFRERESAFKTDFNDLLAIRDFHTLTQKYRLNFLFAAWVMENANPNKKMIAIYQQLKKHRDDLVFMYAHYCLNRAKVFLKYTNNVLTFEDLVNTANEGLIVAVDKYVPNPNKKQQTPFYTVAIGRMVANLIAAQMNAAPVKVTYKPARQLYTIRRYMNKYPDATYEEIARYMNMTTEEVIALLHAMHLVSLDDIVADPDDESVIRLGDLVPHQQATSVYEAIENQNLIGKAMKVFYECLSLLERKTLQMMGMTFDWVDLDINWDGQEEEDECEDNDQLDDLE